MISFCAGLIEASHIFFSFFLCLCGEKITYRTAAAHEVKPESRGGPCSVTATAVYKTLGTLTEVGGGFSIGCFDSWIWLLITKCGMLKHYYLEM